MRTSKEAQTPAQRPAHRECVGGEGQLSEWPWVRKDFLGGLRKSGVQGQNILILLSQALGCCFKLESKGTPALQLRCLGPLAPHEFPVTLRKEAFEGLACQVQLPLPTRRFGPFSARCRRAAEVLRGREGRQDQGREGIPRLRTEDSPEFACETPPPPPPPPRSFRTTCGSPEPEPGRRSRPRP